MILMIVTNSEVDSVKEKSRSRLKGDEEDFKEKVEDETERQKRTLLIHPRMMRKEINVVSKGRQHGFT